MPMPMPMPMHKIYIHTSMFMFDQATIIVQIGFMFKYCITYTHKHPFISKSINLVLKFQL